VSTLGVFPSDSEAEVRYDLLKIFFLTTLDQIGMDDRDYMIGYEVSSTVSLLSTLL
jgi:hypothetical protein